MLGLEDARIDLGKGFFLRPRPAFLHTGRRGSVVRWQSRGRLPISLSSSLSPHLEHPLTVLTNQQMQVLRGVATPVSRALVNSLCDWQRNDSSAFSTMRNVVLTSLALELNKSSTPRTYSSAVLPSSTPDESTPNDRPFQVIPSSAANPAQLGSETCFLVSSFNILEGCDRYVVIAASQTTFSGHVVIRSSLDTPLSYILTVPLVL